MGKALLSLSLTAAAVLLVPAIASATWTHKGKGELGESVGVTLSGNVTLTTSVGAIVCPTTVGATLTKESSEGHVNSYAVSEPAACDLTGSLGAVCGTNGVSKVEKTGSWELTAKESSIEISAIDLDFQLAGCLIPSLEVKGTATATPDKAFAISTLTLSGSQTLYNSLEEEVGSASLGGSPTVSPAATYGVKTAPLVETAWLMDNEHLTEDGEMALSGSFSFSYSGGSVTCTASAVLALSAGEVEEEEPEGEVESFTVPEPSKCVASGALKSLCGEKPVKSVEKTGAWALNANEEDITASGLSLDYKFDKCAITSLRLEGSATLSVTSATAIESVAFSGEAAVFNAEEEGIGSATLGGSTSASPKDTYALEEKEEEEVLTEEGSADLVDVSGPIDEHLEIHFLLHEEFETLGTGIRCTVHWTLTTTDGNAATMRISAADSTLATCEYFGVYEGCELATDEAEGLPWHVHPDANSPGTQDSLTVKDYTRTRTFKESEECPFHTTDLSFPHIHINVDDPITSGVFTEPDPETGTNEGVATGFFVGEEEFELPVAAAATVTLGEWTGAEAGSGAASGTYRIIG